MLPARLCTLLTIGAAILSVGCDLPTYQSPDVAPPTAAEDKEQPVGQPKAKHAVVVIETSKGTIVAELWPDKAPKTVENFLAYVDDGFFDGTIFHRVMKGFMIQGGGFTPDMKQKSTQSQVENEASADVGNDRGTLAMARTNDPHSATAQFFINHADNDGLNKGQCPDGYGYCVFGKVTDGMDVVDAIAGVATTNAGMFENVPAETVEIISIRRQ